MGRLSNVERLARDLMAHYHPELEPVFNVRPEWLQNPETKTALELDILYPELQCAIEIQGRQHTQYIPAFHETREAFERQQRRDALKIAKCQEWGVSLYHLTASDLTAATFPVFLEQFEADHRLSHDPKLPAPLHLYVQAQRAKQTAARPRKSKMHKLGMAVKTSVNQSIWAAIREWMTT